MSKPEFLVTGLVIGLMGLIAGFSVLTARAHTRDVTRLAQVREIQMGLELYFQDASAYPVSGETLALGQALTACLSTEGFSAPCSDNGPTPYMESVPTPPEAGLNELSTCSGVDNAFCYIADGEDYRVQFELERTNRALGLQKGLNCATPDDLKPGACSAITSE